MAVTTNETRIEVDKNVPLIRITREFDAPPEKVFRAHADPELFARWVGPNTTTTRVDELDCRTGGSYRFVSILGDDEYGFFGSFHEVRPNELIVQTFTYEGVPDGVALERLRLVALEGGRTRLETSSLVDTFEGRDAFVASGMEEGVTDGYNKLDALLAG